MSVGGVADVSNQGNHQVTAHEGGTKAFRRLLSSNPKTEIPLRTGSAPIRLLPEDVKHIR